MSGFRLTVLGPAGSGTDCALNQSRGLAETMDRWLPHPDFLPFSWVF